MSPIFEYKCLVTYAYPYISLRVFQQTVSGADELVFSEPERMFVK